MSGVVVSTHFDNVCKVAFGFRKVVHVKMRPTIKVLSPPSSCPHLRRNLGVFVPDNALVLQPCATSALAAPLSVRYGHTDVTVPSFDDVRRKVTKDAFARQADTESQRKVFSSVALGVSTAVALYCAKNVMYTAIAYKGIPAGEVAMGVLDIDLTQIPEGKSATFLWRGKPVFVRHRTTAEVELEESVDMNKLRDPEADHDRVKKPEWLVVLASCTHLGCVPTPNAGEYGGYFCPCHGSHFDFSGRIRRGPAPTNLPVPPYHFLDDATIRIGKPE